MPHVIIIHSKQWVMLSKANIQYANADCESTPIAS